MKIKSIIACGLLLLGVGAATTSCEDMLTADNNLVTTDLAPQDTVYQMMGIVQRMQKLADRTILLGEARADLMDVDPIHASSDIQELARNEVSTNNAYNSPAEYYAVINSCNIYLAYVDSLYQVYGDYYYRKEVIATKCFRAWCYLELAKIYGEVPFVTEPVLTAESADKIVAGKKSGMIEILDYVIRDLEPYAYLSENNALRPSYGASWDGISWRFLFLPVRALLGELYLWRGSAKGKEVGHSDFINAIRMYHDYFNFPGEELNVSYSYTNEWMTTDFRNGMTSYASNFVGASGTFAAVLPLDTTAYYGNTSDLRAIFNSTYANNYYPSLVPSDRISNISKDQDYCFRYNDGIHDSVYYAPKDASVYGGSERYIGDLRLSSIYTTTSNVSESNYNSSVNSTKQYIQKWTDGSSRLTDDKRQTWIYYYRTNILYLHLAEALNLAGFPETAFAVLSHGLTAETFKSTSVNVKKSNGGKQLQVKLISLDEFDRLSEIKTIGYTNTTEDYNMGTWTEKDRSASASNSFVVWKQSVFRRVPKDGSRTMGVWSTTSVSELGAKTQIGIHSIGSGDTEFNEKYRLYFDQSLVDQLQRGTYLAPTVPIYTRPAAPLGYEDGKEEPLSYEVWLELSQETGTDRQKENKYNAYKEEYAAYPEKLQASIVEYEQKVEEYNEEMRIYESDMKILANSDMRAKRQEQVRWLILQEEALEGAFEGTRFYDLLRYQMQDGKVSGVAATIEMPDSVKANYGETPNMTNKPWYLPLPTR